MSHSKNYKPNQNPSTGLNWRLGDSVAILGTIVNVEKTFTGQIMIKIECEGGEVVLMHEKLVTLLGRKEENPA